MKVFSFCLYGTQAKYCQGMIENLKMIEKHYPDWMVYVACGNDVPQHYIDLMQGYSNCQLNKLPLKGIELMNYRFFAIDDAQVEVMFSRDADSRINGRDRFCINEFLNSDKQFHIIRDHYHHKQLIMGGMWGCKHGVLPFKIQERFERYRQGRNMNAYSADQSFLAAVVYPIIKDKVLIHSDMVAFAGEHVSPIRFYNNNNNFCGNVMLIDGAGISYPEFTYWNFDVLDQIRWMCQQQAWKLISHFCKQCLHCAYRTFDSKQRSEIVHSLYTAYYNLHKYEKCQRALALYKDLAVSDSLVVSSNSLLIKLGKTIVGTSDKKRKAKENEIVIIYDDSVPQDYQALPHSNVLIRHSKYKQAVTHDAME